MLPMLCVKFLLPFYIFIAILLQIKIIANVVVQYTSIKNIFKRLVYSYVWGLLILTDKGREKLKEMLS